MTRLLLFIHDVRNRLRWGGRLIDSGLDAELQFGFGSTVELLVDCWIVAVEGHVGPS